MRNSKSFDLFTKEFWKYPLQFILSEFFFLETVGLVIAKKFWKDYSNIYI